MIYKDYTSIFRISDTEIQITSEIGTNRLTNTITRDGSVDTNFAAACVLHKNTALSQAITTTSPPTRVTIRGRWVANASSSTVTTSTATLVVPASNSGNLRLEYDGTHTVQYKISSGSFTTFTSPTTITVANNDTLSFKATGLAEQESLEGSVTDTDTEVSVDFISLLNTTPAP